MKKVWGHQWKKVWGSPKKKVWGHSTRKAWDDIRQYQIIYDHITARAGHTSGPAHAKDMFHICMYISSYIIVDCLMLSYIIPCIPCGVTPVLFSRVTLYFFPRVTPYFFHWGTPYFFSGGNPQVTAHGHFPTLSLGGTSSHTWEGGCWMNWGRLS